MKLCRRALLWFACVAFPVSADGADDGADWPSFRGPGGGGVADGFAVRSEWNADATAGEIDGPPID